MIRKVLSNWWARRTANQWLKDPVFATGLATGRAFIHDEQDGLGYAHEDVKNSLAELLVDRLQTISCSSDRKTENRLGLSQAISEMTKYMVLLPKENFEGNNVRLFEEGKISGELHKHLGDILEGDEWLQKYRNTTPSDITDDQMLAYLYQRWRLLFKVHNAIRIELGDYSSDPKEDWVDPFVEVEAMRNEDAWRSMLGLPVVLEFPDTIHYPMFSVFVDSGEIDPYAEFKELYEESSE